MALWRSEEYRKSLKSLDTEEHIDLWFYRPIGYAWALLARRLGISPNAITITSIFLGVGSGVLIYFNNLWLNILGMLLLIWANSFDSADGQLARLTHQYSRIGRILDGISGDLWFTSIYAAICLRENHFSEFFGEHWWLIWLIAVVAAICHAKQAKMADYYRQFHLYFLKGDEGSELESAKELEKIYRKEKKSMSFTKRWTMYFYLNYTRNQEVLTPQMQQLRRALKERYRGKIPQSFRDEFRKLSLPLMKYTNILSFNWRSIALFISIFCGQPWWYFIFEITILNIILAMMMRRHENICRTLLSQLKANKYR